MATWQQVRKGKLARRPALLPLGAGPLPLPTIAPDGSLSFPDAGDDLVRLDLRILTPGEQLEVLARARADAKAQGVEDPVDSNPIYDLCEMLHTLHLAAVDPDSPDDAPRPFFASVDEIRTSPDLGRDKLAYLFELHQQFQDECSPQRRHFSLDEFLAGILALGGESEETSRRFFELLAPGSRWIFTRTLARQLATSPTPRSASGSPFASSGESSKPTTTPPSVPATPPPPDRRGKPRRSRR